MAKPYNLELSRLGQTFEWAATSEIEILAKALRNAGLSPLMSVGSGGSLTAAHIQAFLHQRWTDRLSRVSTPLEIASGAIDPRTAIWLLSAGGGNVDILSAFKAAVAAEPRQLGILCGKNKSALADLSREHKFSDLITFDPPSGKDGFLATNSLLGFATLLTRAYLKEYCPDKGEWERIMSVVEPLLKPSAPTVVNWKSISTPIWKRGTTLVLYGTTTNVGAIDLESKFTEAALGNVQLADYRNFAHGRHHWLAKHESTSAVLAFLSPDDRQLAERTLAHIPKGVPQARFEFQGSAEANQLSSLVCALYLTGWAGAARGIDPGRPGVPQFGRKLYHLSLPKSRKLPLLKALTDLEEVAIVRKAGDSFGQLEARGQVATWLDGLTEFRSTLLAARYAGIVLDYDGTIVETRDRFAKPIAEIQKELLRIVKSGVRLAIATGRGASVRRELQAVFSQKDWNRILVGYYNGAEVSSLADGVCPDGRDGTCDELASLATALQRHPELANVAKQTNRKFQITLESKQPLPENRLWDLAHELLLTTGSNRFQITRSSHSVDIVAKGVSKRNVLKALAESLKGAPILAIGDRGRWPGNDFELLQAPHALSVDEVSVDPATCWNLGIRGQRGVSTTLQYLQLLTAKKGTMSFPSGAFA